MSTFDDQIHCEEIFSDEKVLDDAYDFWLNEPIDDDFGDGRDDFVGWDYQEFDE